MVNLLSAVSRWPCGYLRRFPWWQTSSNPTRRPLGPGRSKWARARPWSRGRPFQWLWPILGFPESKHTCQIYRSNLFHPRNAKRTAMSSLHRRLSKGSESLKDFMMASLPTSNLPPHSWYLSLELWSPLFDAMSKSWIKWLFSFKLAHKWIRWEVLKKPLKRQSDSNSWFK